MKRRISHAISAVALAWMFVPVAAQCQTADPKLAKLVEDQAARLDRQDRELAELRARLAALEAAKTATPDPAAERAQALAERTPTTPMAAPPPVGVPLGKGQLAPPLPARVVAHTPQQGRVIVTPGTAPGSDGATATRDAMVAAGRIATLEPSRGGASWDRGSPELVSRDGNYSFRPRIRMFTDFGSTSGSSSSARNLTGTEQRLFDLGFEGRIGPEFSYLYEAGFGDNRLTVKNAFVAWTRALDSRHLLEFTVGNRVTGRTMDGSTSINDIHFMERNVVASSTQPQKGFYGLGFRGRIYGPDWHVAFEVAGNDVNSLGNADDSTTYSIRTHWNPLKTRTALVHLGAWAYHEDISPAVTTTQRNIFIGGHVPDALMVQSGTIAAPRKGTGAGVEAAGILKSIWIAGEYGGRNVDAATDVRFRAGSVSAGWFITGETVAYADKIGIWGRQQVLRPVGRGGWGAIELLSRYEKVTLRNGLLGGEGDALTFGANWFLNPNVRLMGNYIFWKTDNASGPVIGSDNGRTIALSMRLTY